MSLMTVVIWGAVLIVAQIVAQTLVLIRDVGLKGALDSRDDHHMPASVLGGRLGRALRNVLETFPIFIALAFVANATGKQGDATILLGAQIWLWARVAYVPVYAAGIPVARTLVWTVSVVGLCLMLWRLF